jgi:hypothetical protein
MSWLKYIIENSTGMERPWIFSAQDEHRLVVKRLGVEGHVVAAGFLQITTAGANCYGSSMTLGIGSRPEDTVLVNKWSGDNV